jgi:hypothetical protein
LSAGRLTLGFTFFPRAMLETFALGRVDAEPKSTMRIQVKRASEPISKRKVIKAESLSDLFFM